MVVQVCIEISWDDFLGSSGVTVSGKPRFPEGLAPKSIQHGDVARNSLGELAHVPVKAASSPVKGPLILLYFTGIQSQFRP